MSDEEVAMGIDPETMMEVFKKAASQKRAVVEFQTIENEDGDRELIAADITEHVEKLEDGI